MLRQEKAVVKLDLRRTKLQEEISIRVDQACIEIIKWPTVLTLTN